MRQCCIRFTGSPELQTDKACDSLRSDADKLVKAEGKDSESASLLLASDSNNKVTLRDWLLAVCLVIMGHRCVTHMGNVLTIESVNVDRVSLEISCDVVISEKRNNFHSAKFALPDFGQTELFAEVIEDFLRSSPKEKKNAIHSLLDKLNKGRTQRKLGLHSFRRTAAVMS